MGESVLFALHKEVKSGEHAISAILPLLKLITVALFGLILTKVQLVPKATFKQLSKLVFVLFLPCLIFTDLGPSITLYKIVRWWFIPVNVIISTTIGCILGYMVALICRPPEELFRFTIIMTAFGNTGNIPLAIVTSVCHSTDNPFGSECSENGIAYASFSQWVSVALVYTLVYHMMEPPLEYYAIVNEGGEIQEVPIDNSRPLLVEAEWPGLEDQETEHSKTPFIARLFNSISRISNRNVPDLDTVEEAGDERNVPDIDAIEEAGDERSENNPISIRCLAERGMVRKIKIVAEQTPIHHILQPPTIASFLAIVIGVIPAVKKFVYSSDGPLEFITDSLDIMSEAMVPSVMLILGGMLAEGPNQSKIGIRTTIGIIVARLLVLPVIGIGVIYLADKWNILISKDDQMYRFVLLLQYTTPSAILLGAVASLRGYAVKEASALLFWQHVCAVVSLSLYMIVFFDLLFSYI
ncbi:protein PIN-LIKES 2-like isoform X2 [Hevea brasiliensis]|uniref:protein PIN-LIKES 2-like isoform X2 n=1 Tax=Hevea brasiliensis TaxID=3981 RepID=UPI0025CE64BE|nr:protein PIN-LIKES 2-like isoform X2 [Hevea brasiliensis]